MNTASLSMSQSVDRSLDKVKRKQASFLKENNDNNTNKDNNQDKVTKQGWSKKTVKKPAAYHIFNFINFQYLCTQSLWYCLSQSFKRTINHMFTT